MKISSTSDVRELYESSVENYSRMMDSEIDLPVYRKTLSRLQERISDLKGCLLDTSCGTGHLLELYFKKFDSERELVGIDLSPSMVANARGRLGVNADIQVGDMRDLSNHASMSISAVLSFFAVHHLDPSEVPRAFQEWSRALSVGGQLIVGAWEGSGVIDYGESSDVIALRYSESELSAWFESAGLSVNRCWIEEVDGFDMQALYLEGSRM